MAIRTGSECIGSLRAGRCYLGFDGVPTKDPKGIPLEYCCVVGDRPEGDAMMQGRFTVSRAALELTDAITKAQSTGDKAMTGV